ncbi:class I SAM-dependent DNA methyltransferase [Flavihumibacter sp. R14]|nr:class I SAM-dependent DNA methyltransferase [Flavihumibacter soli]
MALSWNEIKERAVTFSKEWEDTYNEEAEAKSFIEAFFNVFGITRKRVGTFEHRVKKLSEADGYIDLLWKGNILIEMKSKGKNLDKAFTQAKEYIHGLKEHELPKYILVSDFENFRLFDTEENKTLEFKLKDLVHNVQNFGFIAGYQKRIYKEQDPVNIKAADLMGKLHDRLEEIGYEGHPLEVYLVRILFCLFAEDTTIFEKQQFQNYIEDRTNEDGSDLASKIQELFQVLNTPNEKRFKNIDEQLNGFPYVNGKLFEETLPSASFDAKMRRSLLDCCYIDWSKISPAIFGSMFQSVMNPKERRNLGAHYTSEKNILKLIKPLFLDDLWQEFNSIKTNKGKLGEFHKRISKLKFLDPACGCGNFLVITYRELRLLEIEILRALNKGGQGFLDVREIIWLDVDMMYGIEYEEFPARIAEVAMWLMDHQMNMLISNEFGQYFVRLPLKKAATIVHANALQTDWESVVNKGELSYILGNPPFLGTSYQSAQQKRDMALVSTGIGSWGMLDYVTGWYIKAAQLVQDTRIKVAFVSTNSIVQGEQPGILWNSLYNQYQIKIHFAHKTFKWNNEAKGNAAVHVVIIGFANFDVDRKSIYEYNSITSDPQEIFVKNISPYLIQGNDIVLTSIQKPICNVPRMQSGSAARDGGYLILKDKDKQDLINENPSISQYLRRLISGDDFINNVTRWCIWLKNVNPVEFRNIPQFIAIFKRVRSFRESSSRIGTRKMADLPYLFAEERQPENDFLLVPKVSSENRKYIPIAYLTKENIVTDKTFIIPNATLFHFGILTSLMHNTWMRHTCGRMKSDYSYSNTIVYNNYPWPEGSSTKQVAAVELAAQKVLEVRKTYQTDKVIGTIRSSPPTEEQFNNAAWKGEEEDIIQKGASLADLYDPITMPPDLVKAHNELDKAVDLAYRSQPFTSEAKRMEFLFELYEKYTSGLFVDEKVNKTKSTLKKTELISSITR